MTQLTVSERERLLEVAGHYANAKIGFANHMQGDELLPWRKFRDEIYSLLEQEVIINQELVDKQQKKINRLKDLLNYLPILSNIHIRKDISIEWLHLWSEIEIWYGDIGKKETGEQFLIRMQATFNLQNQNKNDEAGSEEQDKA